MNNITGNKHILGKWQATWEEGQNRLCCTGYTGLTHWPLMNGEEALNGASEACSFLFFLI